MVPGEWLLADEPIAINSGRRTCRLSVRNTGDRAIQVGSHFHFFEVNRLLAFDRKAAFGMRLDVPSGQSIRFEAGDEREVDLVELGGTGRVSGFNNLANGAISALSTASRAKELATTRGFLDTSEPSRFGEDAEGNGSEREARQGRAEGKVSPKPGSSRGKRS